MLKTYLRKSVSLFFILGILFIPLTFYGFDYQLFLTRFIFVKPICFIQNHFFIGALHHIDFSSDTIGLNILLTLLLAIAFIAVLLLNVSKVKTTKLITICHAVSAYYIAAILLKYGFD